MNNEAHTAASIKSALRSDRMFPMGEKITVRKSRTSMYVAEWTVKIGDEEMVLSQAQGDRGFRIFVGGCNMVGLPFDRAITRMASCA